MRHLLSLSLALLTCVTAFADFTVNGIKYSTSGTEATVESNSYSGAITIPSSVKYGGTTYSVTSIGGSAFAGCSGLKRVTIPSSVTSIGSYAFDGCSGLTSVTIPSSVTSIGSDAFSGCSGLTSVTIPSSVTSIGDAVFRGCSGLTSIVVEQGNPKYDSRNSCNAIIATSTNWLIAGCSSTVIPSSVAYIGAYAFDGCSGLTSVTISSSVTYIGGSAFSGCSGLTSVRCKSATPPSGSGSIPTSAIIEIPAGSLAAYEKAWGYSYTYKEISSINLPIDFVSVFAQSGLEDKAGVEILEEGFDIFHNLYFNDSYIDPDFGVSVRQSGNDVWLMRPGGLYQMTSGGRSLAFNNCKAGDVITISANQAPTGNVNNVSLVSSVDGVYEYLVASAGIASVEFPRYTYYQNISRNPSVAYTVRYVDAAGKELKSSVVRKGAMGSTVFASDADKANFKLGSVLYSLNTQKTSLSMKVGATESNNVLTLVFNALETVSIADTNPSYTAEGTNLSAGTMIASSANVTARVTNADLCKLTSAPFQGDYLSVAFDGAPAISFGPGSGIAGNSNPSAPSVAEYPSAVGSSLSFSQNGFQVSFDAKSNGFLYVVGRLFSAKNFYVVESSSASTVASGDALAYKFVGVNSDFAPALSNGIVSFAVPSNAKGYYPGLSVIPWAEYVAAGAQTYDATSGTWEANSSSSWTDKKLNTLAVIYFPVKAGKTYTVFANGSKINFMGYAFSTTEKSISFVTNGGSVLEAPAIADNMVADPKVSYTVRYVDAAGKAIKSAASRSAAVGSAVSATSADKANVKVGDVTYTLDAEASSHSATLGTTAANNVLTLVFNGTVGYTVRYVDAAGKAIKSAASRSAAVGSAVSATSADKANVKVGDVTYSLDSEASTLSATLGTTAANNVLTLVFNGTVGYTVRYVDAAGKAIKSAVSRSAAVGSAVSATSADKANVKVGDVTYTLDAEASSLSATLGTTAANNVLSLVFSGEVGYTVRYVDAAGNELKTADGRISAPATEVSATEDDKADFKVGDVTYTLDVEASTLSATLGATAADNVLSLVFTRVAEELPTHVLSPRANRAATGTFDLTGRKMNGRNLRSGIYVRNGKKIRVK